MSVISNKGEIITFHIACLGHEAARDYRVNLKTFTAIICVGLGSGVVDIFRQL